MLRLAVSVAHRLGRVEAKRRIQKLLEKVRDPGGIWSRCWSSDARFSLEGHVNGHAVTGDVTVQDASVDATVILPWSLVLFAGRIRKAVEHATRQVLREP